LEIAFDGDVLFLLPPIFLTIHKLSQMQGMDKKYDGHAWCKVITTNIKNNFGFSFKKAHCLGHLCCVQDNYENFVHIASHNEMFWCSEYTHILVIGQITMSPSTLSFVCKFCHVPPICVMDYNGRIYYGVHRLQSISRAVIHLGVHKHPMVDGKCREFVNKTKRLITEEVNCMLDAKIFVISLSASKTFLATHLLDESGDDLVELLKGEQLEKIQSKFYKLSLPNIHNLVASFKHHSGHGYIDSILELKSKSCYDYIQEC